MINKAILILPGNSTVDALALIIVSASRLIASPAYMSGGI